MPSLFILAGIAVVSLMLISMIGSGSSSDKAQYFADRRTTYLDKRAAAAPAAPVAPAPVAAPAPAALTPMSVVVPTAPTAGRVVA